MTTRATATGWEQDRRAAQVYAETFGPLCAGVHEALLDRGGVEAGRAVLDVGAGSGDLAARALGRGARVTALDPDPAMLALTQQRAPGAHLVRAGLPDLPLTSGSAGTVLASFVVNHVPDPRACVAELARVVSPGARVVASIWPSGRTEQARLWSDVLAEVGVVPSPSARLAPERDFARSADGLAGLFEDAGLVDVSAGTVSWEHRAAPDSLWRGAAAGLGGIGATVTSQPEPVREQLRAAYDRLVGRLVVGGTLVLRTDAVIAVGTRV